MLLGLQWWRQFCQRLDRLVRRAPAAGAPRPRRLARYMGWFCWGYLAAVLCLWLLLATASDRWGYVTALMFGPRWAALLPLGVLGPLAAMVRRRLLCVLVTALIVVGGPVMGFCVPWGCILSTEPGGIRIRVLTCNTHGSELEPAALRALIAETRPDIVALQDSLFSHQRALFDQELWFIRQNGGQCLASRYPIRDTAEPKDRAPPTGRVEIAHYELDAPPGTVQFFNVHLATPRDALVGALYRPWRAGRTLHANTTRRREQSRVISAWAHEFDGPVLLAGDFNTPTDSAVYRQYWSSFRNAFSTCGWGWGYTHYVEGVGVRIDHILAGPGWRCRRCWVGPNVGSAHRPLMADLEWVEAPY